MSNNKRMTLSSTSIQESPSAVNLERADFILSTGAKNNRTLLLHLRNLADDIKARQKKNRVFYETFAMIKPYSISNINSMAQNMQRLKSTIRKMIEVDLTSLQKQSKLLEMKMPTYEDKLSSTREYAEQRRDKKAMRERQYHQLYYVPVLSQEFRKKYIRARDKNSIAEEKLCEVREMMDRCQKDISSTSRLISETNKKVESMTADYDKIKNNVQKLDKVLQDLQEEQGYWKSFDSHQSMLALNAVDDLIGVILKNTNISGSNILDINNEWIKVFRMKCYEYGQAEQHGEKRWNQRSVDFSCSRCKVFQNGWPTPSKLHSSHLLCTQCYNETRTSMIVGKKMNKLNDKLKLDKKPVPNPCKPEKPSFMKPLPSNPAFKKVFTMIKGN